MSRLIDIDDEKFWDVLFDEACVEGNQAERIKNELNKISVDEKEIRDKAFDDFVERLKEEYKPIEDSDTDICRMVFKRFDKIAEEMKG